MLECSSKCVRSAHPSFPRAAGERQLLIADAQFGVRAGVAETALERAQHDPAAVVLLYGESFPTVAAFCAFDRGGGRKPVAHAAVGGFQSSPGGSCRGRRRHHHAGRSKVDSNSHCTFKFTTQPMGARPHSACAKRAKRRATCRQRRFSGNGEHRRSWRTYWRGRLRKEKRGSSR